MEESKLFYRFINGKIKQEKRIAWLKENKEVYTHFGMTL